MMAKLTQVVNFMKHIPIAYFENRYAITPTGLIKNLANNTYLTPIANPNGYLKVGLANGEGGHKQYAIHRLVALHFLPNPYGYNCINHIDGIKTNNNVANLEWCNYKQNNHHAFKTGLRPGYMSADEKEKHLFNVLKGVQVSSIATDIGRRPETLHKMLRETANRLGLADEWSRQMKENRKNAAIQNLKKINS